MKVRNINVSALWGAIPVTGKMIVRNAPFKITLSRSKQNIEQVSFDFSDKALLSVGSTCGFEVIIGQENKGTEILLRRSQFNDETDIFFTLVEDLICIGDQCNGLTQQECAHAVVNRIEAWRKFMKSDNKNLSDQAELGLLGELIVLKQWLESGGCPLDVHSIWTGPMRGARDFTFPRGEALEIKTTLCDERLKVTVDSLEQLDTTDFPKLSLVTVQVKEDDTGISLLSLFKEISLLLAHSLLQVQFESTLVSLGYRPSNPGRDLRNFKIIAIRVFKANSLPRLLPNQIKGIVKAKYEILISPNQNIEEEIQEEQFDVKMKNLTLIEKS